MENKDKRSYSDQDNHNEVFSKSVKAGKRTYFFDVKLNRLNDLFVIVTESRKTLHDDGSVTYQKNRVHVHVEDFEKFMDGLKEAMAYAKTNSPDVQERPIRVYDTPKPTADETPASNSYTDVNFDDLGSDKS